MNFFPDVIDNRGLFQPYQFISLTGQFGNFCPEVSERFHFMFLMVEFNFLNTFYLNFLPERCQ